jgi:hypothetical protein
VSTNEPIPPATFLAHLSPALTPVKVKTPTVLTCLCVQNNPEAIPVNVKVVTDVVSFFPTTAFTVCPVRVKAPTSADIEYEALEVSF